MLIVRQLPLSRSDSPASLAIPPDSRELGSFFSQALPIPHRFIVVHECMTL